MVEGTASDKVIEAIKKIPEDKREQVKEVTLDLSDSMRKIVRRCFPKSCLVIDRFHVQKLAFEALQEKCTAHRWDDINEETEAMEEAKLSNKKYEPQILENGDSKKQLLARSRYLLFKAADKWTEKQRAKLLVKLYPDLKEAYSLTHSL
jgi:transposase